MNIAYGVVALVAFMLTVSAPSSQASCVDPYPYPLTCGENEEFKQCGTACPKTCANMDTVQFCTKQCVAGCFLSEHHTTSFQHSCIKCLTHLFSIFNTVAMKPVSMFACLIVLIVALQTVQCACPYAHPYPTYECGPYEEYQQCGTACPKTCQDREDKACTLQCVEGCFCKPGYIRENEHGKCIPECVTMKSTQVLLVFAILTFMLTSNASAQYECGPNEYYDDCGNIFELNCRRKQQTDPFECDEGCFYDCAPNEYYTDCESASESASESNCADADKWFVSFDDCVPGCYCNDGLLREGEDGPCIMSFGDAKRVRTATMKSTKAILIAAILTITLASVYSDEEDCGPNEYYSECGPEHELTCQRREFEIDTEFCVKGCFCVPGYLREFIDDCGPNEIYNECGPKFEVICAQRDFAYVPDADCVPGCFCEEGFIRESAGGKCITEWECEERFPRPGNCPTGSDCEDIVPLT
uniref:TIL domain-containing protein n=1 Tax=Anopheles minimus TaxID=112268 RepID=A0A182WBS7_9DIPT